MEKEFIYSLVSIFDRDLNKLEEEIKLYSDGQSLWKIAGETKNSAGNLCLHLCGNLQHFIGTILGNTSYVRNRDLEFSAKDIPVAQLVSEIQKTREVVKSTLTQIDISLLRREYPIQVFGSPMTTTYFLTHLTAHLGYHLGQINYHRRITTGR